MLKVQKFLRECSDSPEQSLEMLAIKHDIKLVFSPNETLVNLNYNQIDNFGKHNPINMECRGLVLDYADDFKVVAKGFNRFFNFEESPTVTRQFNWKNFSTLEKVDGSLILIYHYKGIWRVNSRGSFGDKPCGDWDKNWEEAVWSVIDETAFDLNADKNCTYICELWTPHNQVVTIYEENTVFLLSIVNNETLVEVPVDKVSLSSVGFKYPKEYSFSGVEELQEKLKEQNPLFEGYVVKDDKGMRLKIKAESYLKLHRLRGNNGQNFNKPECILGLILENEQDEIIASMPETASKFEHWQNILDAKISEVVARYNEVRDIKSQKDFAINVNSVKNPFNWMLFEARKHGVKVKSLFYNVQHQTKIIEGILNGLS